MTIQKPKIMSFLGAGSLSALFISAIIGFSASAQAQRIELKFNTLPTKQGWTYEHANNNLGELQVFQKGRGVLHQDTVKYGQFQTGGGDNGYWHTIASPSIHFAITVKATFIDEALLYPGLPGCGFSFGASIGPNGNDEYYNVCLGKAHPELAVLLGGVAIANPPNAASFDPTKEHTYRLDVWPSVGARLFVDGTLIYKSGVTTAATVGATNDQVPPHSLFFGDGTGGANAKVDIRQFVYSEDRSSQK